MRFQFNGETYFIDNYLAENLNSIVYNIKNDWDFIIAISGDRTVRVGKSTLGITVAAYLSWALGKAGINSPYTVDNIFFDHKTMVKRAMEMPPHSIIHYDEGREGLGAAKWAKDMQKDLLDFFAECGQLNHIFIIVLPDFFGLAEEIAIPRAEFLLNVYRKNVVGSVDLFKTGEQIDVVRFVRGQFQFFSRRKKQLLWEVSRMKRRKSYGLVKADFVGTFSNQWPVDKTTYVEKKRKALARFDEKEKQNKQKGGLTKKQKLVLAHCLQQIPRKEWPQIGEDYGMARNYCSQFMLDMKKSGFLGNSESSGSGEES